MSCTRGRTGPCAGAQLSSPLDMVSLARMPLLFFPPVAFLARSEIRGA